MQASFPSAVPPPSANLLLAALPAAEYRKLLPHLEHVSLPLDTVIFAEGARVTHGYFPTTAVVSQIPAFEGHLADEVALTGNEGMIGVSLLLEGDEPRGPPRRTVVQSAGDAYRLPAGILLQEFLSSVELRRLLLRYTQALLTQIAQIALCNRRHRVPEQVCRWLLLRLDRSPGGVMRITQERIATLLGVRREAVTQALHDLQRARALRCRRGSITVLDRPRLERDTCECYGVVRAEYARLLALGHGEQGTTTSAARAASASDLALRSAPLDAARRRAPLAHTCERDTSPSCSERALLRPKAG